MNPIAFTIGSIEVRWYGIILASAMVVGLFLALREARRQGENEDKFISLFFFVIPAAIVGARLYYVIFSGNLGWYLSHPLEILATWHGGLAIHGGLLGGFLAGWLYTRHAQVEFWKWGDIIAPSIILGQAIGRWGNYFNQEAYGRETTLPWAMYIDGAWRHPTFLYESIWNLGVFGILLLLRRKIRFSGELVLWYFLLYSSGRLWIEGLRTDSLMIGPLRVAQAVSLSAIVLSGAIIWWGRRRKTSKA